MSENTIPALFEKQVKDYGTRLLFQRRDGWSWKQITWLDFDREVKNIASFLMDLGFQKGDSALTVSANTLEAVSTEIAVYHLGGKVVPLSSGTGLSDIKEAAAEKGIKFVFIEDPSLLDTATEIVDEIPEVLRAAFFRDVKTKNEKVLNFRSILKFGLMKKKKLEDELKKVSDSVAPGDAAAVFSGSGGIITQGDILSAVEMISLSTNGIGPEDQSFSYIASSSPYSKIISYLNFYNNTRAATAESREEYYKDIPEVMPTVLYETREGLISLYNVSQSAPGGLSPDMKLKRNTGGRLKYIFTDELPEPQIESVFRSAGAEFNIVPEPGGADSK